MVVGFFVDPVFYKVGTGDFLNSFFSTIFVRLEQSDWGSKYPVIMNDLYKGELNKEFISQAEEELKNIRAEFKKYTPDDIVWDFEDVNAPPPWGTNISSDIKNLSDYFVTSDGKNLIDVLFRAMEATKELEENLIVRSI